MRFYTNQHQYYCGIDLHTKNMYVCILDQAGKILVHKNIPTSPHALLNPATNWCHQLGEKHLFEWDSKGNKNISGISNPDTSLVADCGIVSVKP